MNHYTAGYIVGSLARDSINRKLAATLVQCAPDELRMVEIPINELPLYNRDLDDDFPPPANALKHAIASLDAVLFITPEYNRCIPASLKNAIDWASRPWGANSFTGKPTAIAGASPSRLGTALAQQSLRSILQSCGAQQLPGPEVHINFTPSLINNDGVLTEPSTEGHLRTFMHTFADFIATATPPAGTDATPRTNQAAHNAQ